MNLCYDIEEMRANLEDKCFENGGVIVQSYCFI